MSKRFAPRVVDALVPTAAPLPARSRPAGSTRGHALLTLKAINLLLLHVKATTVSSVLIGIALLVGAGHANVGVNIINMLFGRLSCSASARPDCTASCALRVGLNMSCTGTRARTGLS